MEELLSKISDITQVRSAKNLPAKQNKLFEKIEAITKDARYLQDSGCSALPQYQLLWVEYASLVKDAKDVYLLMEENGIGKNEPSYFISFALYYEKYERDF